MRILLIEDNPGDARLVQELLKETRGHFTISVAEKFEQGLKLLLSQAVDAVLLDLNLPDSRGMATLTELQTRFPQVPFVIMTSIDDEELARQAVRFGAQDYLVKGSVTGELLRRTLLYAVERKRAEEALRAAHDELEQRVQDRTKELNELNETLEKRVAERTAELQAANETLRASRLASLNLMEDALAARGLAEEANAELAAANKELEAFSYAVSHDLRAPLRSIEGFTNAILEDHAASLDDAAKDYFRRVTSASQRMSQLIEAMLNMARLTKGELREQAVDLTGLAEVVAHELRKKDPSRTVEFVVAKKMKARGDTDMLRVVVENLLDNAWKFTAGRSSARIEFGVFERGMRNGERSARDVPSGPDSTIRDPQSAIVYFVRDDGAGFDMAFADKLFKPFQRLHKESEFPGLGVGLATVKRIVERHGGRIWAESEHGKGTTFYFTLQ